MEYKEELVICVSKDDRHCDDSILMSCSKCNKDVWVSPHNLGRKPVCMECAAKLENTEIVVTVQDMLKALREMKKRQKDDKSLQGPFSLN